MSEIHTKEGHLKAQEEKKFKPISPFNEHYYKSRNSLLLFSGILLAWELIGVNVESAETSGIKVSIKEVDAIPYVLFILIVYFLYRVIIEWYQSPYERRLLKQSRIDLGVTLIIPFSSMATYSIQRWLDLSIFNSIQTNNIILIIASIFSIVVLYKILRLFFQNAKEKTRLEAHNKSRAEMMEKIKDEGKSQHE